MTDEETGLSHIKIRMGDQETLNTCVCQSFNLESKLQLTNVVTSVGWILGFLGILNSVIETSVLIAQIEELQKLFIMIPHSNQFPGNLMSQIRFLTFA